MSGRAAVTSTTVMGPEGADIRVGNMPPLWDGVTKPYRMYHEELLNWKDFTTLPPERHAPAAIIRMTGEPQRLALTVPRDDRKAKDGLEKIIKKFDEVYSSTEEQDMYFFYKQLTKFRRKDAGSAQEYLSGFTTRAERLKGSTEVKIPQKLLSMMLIDFADLTDEQENNLFGACGGDLDFVKVSRALKLVLKESGNNGEDSAYIGDQKFGHKFEHSHRGNKFCRYCKKKGHNIEECWKLSKKNEKKNGNKNSSQPIGKWKNNVYAARTELFADPILDSAAGYTLIGETTLREYCNLLKIKELDKYDAMKETHSFGRYGSSIPTKCSVAIPLPIRNYTILVRADVLPGEHPFLISGDTQERMKGKLLYSRHQLVVEINSKKVHIDLIKPDKHYIIPISGATPTYITSFRDDAIDFKKLHVNTGHSSLENMKQLLQHAGLWNVNYADAVQSVIDDCTTCIHSGTPKSAPTVDISHIEPVFNTEVETDVLFLQAKPFLHSECKKTKFSAIIALENREATNLWNAFTISWLFGAAHGPPKILQVDPEFDNKVFHDRCKAWGIDLRITAAKAKWQQGIIERGNGVLRAIFNKLNAENPTATLYLKAAHAAFAKNVMFGSKKLSSYELVYRRSFPIDGSSTILTPGMEKEYLKAVARRKIGTALHARDRILPNFAKNEYLYFYRKSYGGFVGPAKVMHIEPRGNMEVLYQGRTYSVSKDFCRKIQQPLEFWLEELAPEHRSEDPSTASQADINSGAENKETQEKLTLKLRNYRPGDPTPESNVQRQNNPENSAAPEIVTAPHTKTGPSAGTRSQTRAQSTSYAADLKVFYREDGMATENEYKNAFMNELKSWIEEQVFEEVPKSAKILKHCNTISSHVVYKWKDGGSSERRLKARIVPHGNRDLDKNVLRTDSPSMKSEIFRLIITFALDHEYDLSSMDVKTAFLQTGSIEREVYMIPPKEFGNDTMLWKLLKTVYGLMDGPIKWYNHCRTTLLKFGLTPSKIDPTLYYMEDENEGPHRLVVGTQVDDFVYTGDHKTMLKFESFIRDLYTVGRASKNYFDFNGVSILHSRSSGVCTLIQNGLQNIEKITIGRTRSKMADDAVTNLEKNHFRSINGSLLWYGVQTSPHLLYVSSIMARKVEHLKVKHLKAINSVLKRFGNVRSTLKYTKASVQDSVLLVFTDASHATNNEVTSQEGSIIFKWDKKNNVVCPLLWCSRKVRRVVKSTLASESIAAVDGYDDGVYIQYLLEEIYQFSIPIQLCIDSKSLFDLITSTHTVETTEKRLKIDLPILTEAFANGNLSTVTWIPRKYQLADALTKADIEAADFLQRTLNEGELRVDFSEGISKGDVNHAG